MFPVENYDPSDFCLGGGWRSSECSLICIRLIHNASSYGLLCRYSISHQIDIVLSELPITSSMCAGILSVIRAPRVYAV